MQSLDSMQVEGTWLLIGFAGGEAGNTPGRAGTVRAGHSAKGCFGGWWTEARRPGRPNQLLAPKWPRGASAGRFDLPARSY